MFLLVIPVLFQTAEAKGRTATRVHKTHRSHSAHRSQKAQITRPVQRTSAARTAFRHKNPCPATNKTTGPCPGYVIDHKQALKRGGPDTPENMQWQTKQAAKAKDRIE